jgi:hypothetical protein
MIQIIEQYQRDAILDEAQSATAARQKTARMAVLCANHFGDGELVDRGGRWLADQPAYARMVA